MASHIFRVRNEGEPGTSARRVSLEKGRMKQGAKTPQGHGDWEVSLAEKYLSVIVSC